MNVWRMHSRRVKLCCAHQCTYAISEALAALGLDVVEVHVGGNFACRFNLSQVCLMITMLTQNLLQRFPSPAGNRIWIAIVLLARYARRNWVICGMECLNIPQKHASSSSTAMRFNT